jgi:hypothetical protein
MGDATAWDQDHTLKVRDGGSGTTNVLIDAVATIEDEYATVEFEDKIVPACAGAIFTPQPESSVLTVTNGYIDIIQLASYNGGSLVLVEIWSLDGHVKSAGVTPSVVRTHLQT